MSSEAEPQEQIPMPTPVGQDKTYPPKITDLVDQIAQLNLLEVADLNALLKTRLNITESAPVIMGGMAAPAAAPATDEEEEDAAPAAVQTSFTIKLNGFDAAKKVALIKELKSNLEGMNLVQAKKFVEACPAVVKSDIGKDEAETLKKALEGAGGQCVIEWWNSAIGESLIMVYYLFVKSCGLIEYIRETSLVILRWPSRPWLGGSIMVNSPLCPVNQRFDFHLKASGI